MARKSEPQQDVRTAGSPWTRPPESPSPYRLAARLSDMLHGWLDGRRGIPGLPEDRIAEVDMRPEEPAGTDVAPAAPRAAPDLRTPRIPELWTPRMEVLVRQARERTEGERIKLADDLAVLMRKAAHSRQTTEGLAEQLTACKQALNQAREPLTDIDLARRRLAEQDARSRPDELVSDRRHAAWERQRSAAEQRYQTAVAQHAEARQTLLVNESLIRERTAVARSAGRRHYELALRRIATYLQQLVRKHRRGPELNALLLRYRVGPDLPEWVLNATEETSGS
ncbi:MAG: hypothetical protein ACRDNZ_24670 [Streptosporangiaceae bacterium]